MKALKTALLTVVMMVMVMAWAQNGAPQLIWSDVFNFFGDNHQICDNLVTINDDIFIRVTTWSQVKIIQLNKHTRESGWQRNLGYNENSGFAPNQLVTDGYNLAVVDSGFIVRKISAQTGQDIWIQSLYGSPVQTWTLYATGNNLICRGNRGGLAILDWQNGEFLSQLETPIDNLTPMGIHTISSQDRQIIYLADVCLDGQYWNTAWRVTKIILSDDLESYQQAWQVHLVDETFPKISLHGNYLYVQSMSIDSTGATIMKIRRIDPNDGEIMWSQDIGTQDEYDITKLIPNGQDVIAYGLHYGDYRPVLVNYNPSGDQTWSYSAPLPSGGFQYAIHNDAVWDGNTLILAGFASYSTETSMNCRPWLSAVATTTATNDPTTPVVASQLTCYPNPFRGSTNVKFNQIDSSPTTVVIYNTRGQLVRTLVNSQKMSPGEHSFTWDGKTNSGQPTAAGVYFYKMTSGRFSATRKMIMMK